MDLAPARGLLRLVDFGETTFCVAVAAIIFNPLFWNLVARWEHRTRRLTALFGSPYVACYCLGFVILLLNVCRSHSMTVAMKAQPRWDVLERTEVYYMGVVLMVVGTVLVVSSFLALGFTGTFLGDYFGILMDEKATGFPFNLIENPMYWGSTANYFGLALIEVETFHVCLVSMTTCCYAHAPDLMKHLLFPTHGNIHDTLHIGIMFVQFNHKSNFIYPCTSQTAQRQYCIRVASGKLGFSDTQCGL
uniref:Phosphatidylethanolamine N-methyltransferase n=1 Tax=Neogobius melanostomus TaxID=47308 RepID=A0A8C6TPM5_9GOBI